MQASFDEENNPWKDDYMDEASAHLMPDLMKKFEAVQLGKEDMPPATYEDTDQSLVYGDEAAELRCRTIYEVNFQYDLLSRSDAYVNRPKLSEWLKIIYAGDYKQFIKYLEVKTDEEVSKLVKMRETTMNVGALDHVIRGAHRAKSESMDDLFDMKGSPGAKAPKIYQKGEDHLKIMKKLLSIGAEINAHDVSGFTALHTCMVYDDKILVDFARALLKAGADVNALNRFGETPMMTALYHGRFRMNELLEAYGADKTLADTLGQSPQSFLETSLKSHMPGHMQKEMVKAEKEGKEIEFRIRMGHGDEGFKVCKVCFKKGVKKCSGCYLVYYCSRECQLKEWEEHKPSCQVIDFSVELESYEDVF